MKTSTKKKGGESMSNLNLKQGDIIGYLELHNRYMSKRQKAYWDCTCQLCGNNKAIREDSLTSGKIVSDGCYKKTKIFSDKMRNNRKPEDLTGKVFYELTVLCLSENRTGKAIMWKCLCSCGKIVDVAAGNLKSGNSKTCGDYEAHRKVKLQDVWKQTLDDLTGQIFGDWLVKCRDGTSQPTRWICECENCGTIKSVLGNALKKGQSTSCGCRKHNPSLTGKTVGKWLVGKRNKRKRPNGHYCTTYLCTCECGTERYVDESRLLNGTSLSCGCVKSAANEYIASVLTKNGYKYTPEYKYNELRGPGNGLLRFDFAIHNSKGEVVCLIEYQGAQHYIEQEYGKVQREITDQMKRQFCKKHKIRLYEIKYSDNIDAKLEKIFTQIAC